MGGGEKTVVGKLKGKLVLKFISISEINPVAFAVSKFQRNNIPRISIFLFLQELIDSAINSIWMEFNIPRRGMNNERLGGRVKIDTREISTIFLMH